MKVLSLSDIIGKTIVSIRYSYNNRNEYDLHEFYSYLKLSSGDIIDIPIYDSEELYELSVDNINYYTISFEKGKEIVKSAQELIYGNKIEDVYFCYYNNIINDDMRAFLKLSNGYYLTEKNFGPIGVIGVDLRYYDQKQFEEKIKSFNLTVKSFVKEIKD